MSRFSFSHSAFKSDAVRQRVVDVASGGIYAAIEARHRKRRVKTLAC